VKKKKKKKKKHSKETIAKQTLMRDRERFGLESLQLDVNALKQEILNLQKHQFILKNMKRLNHATTPIGSCVKILREYFQLFQRGLIIDENIRGVITRQSQEDFVRSVMVPDMAFGSFQGHGAFITQWHRYSAYHDSLYLKVPSFQVSGSIEEPVVSGTSLLAARINRKTITNVFPHLLSDEAFVQKLIGQQIYYPCNLQVYFNEDRQIVRFDIEVEFVTALASILTNDLNQVQKMVQDARIIESCHLEDQLQQVEKVRRRLKSAPENSSLSTKSSLNYILNK
jgi:hypothetical protein